MAEQVVFLIEKLPPYLCYIYPGYISMFLFYYFRGITLDDTKAKFIKSVIISYMYIVLLKGIGGFVLDAFPFIDISIDIKSFVFNLLLFIISIGTPYLIYVKLFEDEGLIKVLNHFKINTAIDINEIDLLQRMYSDTIWLRVYMKDSNVVYSGSLTESELETKKIRFFCLSKYRKYIINDDGTEKELKDYSQDEKEKVLIYFDQISHFEVVNIDKKDSDNK